MTDKKRKQHYVWAHYLSAWEMDGRIQCDRNGHRFGASTDGLANERDFYRLRELTPQDVFYVNALAQGLPPPCPQFAAKWLGLFQLPSRYSKLYEQAGQRSPEFEAALDTLVNNLEENLHAEFEGQALPVLAALKQRDPSPVFDPQVGVTTAMYLGLQYFRTPGMMRRIKTIDFRDLPGFNVDAAWGVLRCIWATALGSVIYARNDHARITFLHSGADARFVTSDQPIVNLRVLPDGSSREVELYYALSPDLAMLLSLDAERPTTVERQLSAAETVKYNARLAAERETQIYAADAADFDFGAAATPA